MWQGDAETADTEFRNNRQKIAELAHRKREINGINAARRESRVVQQRRERMTDRIANHPVDPRAARERVCAVEMLHLGERNLAGCGRLGNRSVSQLTSLAQGEDSRRQAGFAHRNGHKSLRISRQTKEPETVVDAPRFGRDLHGIDSAMRRRVHAARQIRSALKVVHGKQDARRHGIFANGLAGKLAQGFHFDIAPLATGFAGLNQPVEFAVDGPGKLASAFAAAAGREKCGLTRLALPKPVEESRALRVAAQPIEAQLHGPGLPQGGAHHLRHFGCRGGRHDRAYPP